MIIKNKFYNHNEQYLSTTKHKSLTKANEAKANIFLCRVPDNSIKQKVLIVFFPFSNERLNEKSFGKKVLCLAQISTIKNF
jgi:hypothetical protein